MCGLVPLGRRAGEPLRDAGLHQLDNPRDGCFRIVSRHEVEVAVALGPGKIGPGALVDPVSIGAAPALRRLADDLGQTHDGHRTGGNALGQHLTRATRWPLVDIADDQPRGPFRDCSSQRRHPQDVDHGGFVDDQPGAGERGVAVAREAAARGGDLQQPVDGLRLEPARTTTYGDRATQLWCKTFDP